MFAIHCVIHFVPALGRCFYSNLPTVHSGYTFFSSTCVRCESSKHNGPLLNFRNVGSISGMRILKSEMYRLKVKCFHFLMANCRLGLFWYQSVHATLKTFTIWQFHVTLLEAQKWHTYAWQPCGNAKDTIKKYNFRPKSNPTRRRLIWHSPAAVSFTLALSNSTQSVHMSSELMAVQ